MHKFFIPTLLFIVSINCYSSDNLKNNFSINVSFKPDFEREMVYRGAAINYKRNLIENLFTGLGLRLMHNNYSSLYSLLGTDINLSPTLSIPLEAGFGAEVLSLDFLEDNENVEYNLFIHSRIGIQWRIDSAWYYYLSIVYCYNLKIDEKSSFIGNLGVKYRF